MKALKITAIVVVVLYIGIVVAFESLLGYSQPQSQGTMVVTTVDDEGAEFDRVVSRLVTDEQLYVAVNHWPRNWYYRTLDNPNVYITFDGVKAPYVARQLEGEEYELIDSDHPLGLVFRVLTGFPPRHILSLEPASPAPLDEPQDLPSEQ